MASQAIALEENIDEKILAQQDAIEKEIASNQPLVGSLIRPDSLSVEYLLEDDIYQKKVKSLASKYRHMRRTRGDGNCFFRAFAFSYFESLIGKPNEIDNFVAMLKSNCEDLCKNLGYCQFTVDDFCDNVVDVVNSLNTITVDELVAKFNEPGLSDYIVVYLRLIVSCYLQKNAEFFECFIDGYATIKDFCSHEVEPMYRESDHIHVIALTKATNVPVRIIYMDRSDTDEITPHDFPEDSKPNLHILYRPGHYDILYQ